MSRRRRARPDKRATSLALARFIGHGAPLPGEPPEQDDEQGFEDEAPADHRIPIGPLDVAQQESHA